MSHSLPGSTTATLAEQIPADARSRFDEVVALTDAFCQEHLNDEYREGCRRLTALICLTGGPILQGKAASWASGIAYCLGQVNFLTDSTQSPHLRSDEIARAFGVSPGTMQSKARDIREGLQVMQFDPRFTLPSRLEQNPLVWMLEVNGLLMDIRSAPREAQLAAYEEGLIPYVPADGPPEHIDWLPLDFAAHADTEPAPRTDVIYQLKITLKHVEPPIWRRIEVPDSTLEDLHYTIQAAMGWQNCHMHQFIVGKQRFTAVEMFDGDSDDNDAAETLLSDIVPERSRKFRFAYEYDFGDGWMHEIVVERRAAPQKGVKYPSCLGGERACPPEDCGGPWGYMDLLAAIADPEHERHDEYMEWCGSLDPDAFDCQKTTLALRRKRP
ncbi:MAG: plasmid pRiA4b ORF-3 family protein [Pirellulales bacterium]